MFKQHALPEMIFQINVGDQWQSEICININISLKIIRPWNSYTIIPSAIAALEFTDWKCQQIKTTHYNDVYFFPFFTSILYICHFVKVKSIVFISSGQCLFNAAMTPHPVQGLVTTPFRFGEFLRGCMSSVVWQLLTPAQRATRTNIHIYMCIFRNVSTSKRKKKQKNKEQAETQNFGSCQASPFFHANRREKEKSKNWSRWNSLRSPVVIPIFQQQNSTFIFLNSAP